MCDGVVVGGGVRGSTVWGTTGTINILWYLRDICLVWLLYH